MSEKTEIDRIAKVMARAGVCSRRDAERMIAQGRVSVNGKTLDSPALNVSSSDKILVDNKPLPRIEAARLFLYHKPAGLVTTHRDERGRKTVFDALPDNLPRLLSVGRLDLNTEGLLLLTNDGALARHLELPSTGWKRRYRVRVHGSVTQKMLDGLKNGITYEGIRYGAIEANLEKHKDNDGANQWIEMAIKEGKNREVRKIMESLGLQVNRLIRVSYGPFQLGALKSGAVREVPAKTITEQVGHYNKGS